MVKLILFWHRFWDLGVQLSVSIVFLPILQGNSSNIPVAIWRESSFVLMFCSVQLKFYYFLCLSSNITTCCIHDYTVRLSGRFSFYVLYDIDENIEHAFQFNLPLCSGETTVFEAIREYIHIYIYIFIYFFILKQSPRKLLNIKSFQNAKFLTTSISNLANLFFANLLFSLGFRTQ